MRFMPTLGRSVTARPWQWLWIEMAASWPCATAQMMFCGPNAASPPKNTPGRVVDDDLDLLLLGVLELPGRGLEELARPARHDLDVGRAEAFRGAAAVHRRVADADDEHALLDRRDVPERHRLEPLDADVDV